MTTISGSRMTDSGSWITGLDLYYDDVSSSRVREDIASGQVTEATPRFPNGSSMELLSAYGNGTWSVGARHALTAGVRLSDVRTRLPSTSVNNTEVSGDIGWVATINDGWQFTANLGYGFRAPNVFDLGTLGSRPGNRFNVPNPNLEPESGMACDAGAEFQPQANFKLGIRAFLNKVDDAIVENVISEDPSQTQSINAGEAESYGLEVSAEHSLTQSLSWFANLTWTESEISNPLDADQDGSELSFSPDLVINAGLHFSLPGSLMLSPYL